MTHPGTHQTLAERYGTTRPGRSLRTVVPLAVLVALLLGWLLWAAWEHSNPEVTGELRTYDVVSPHRVKLTVDITRDGSAAVTCTAQAQASDHTVVGEDTIVLPAGEPGDARLTVALTTEREASSVNVTDCRSGSP